MVQALHNKGIGVVMDVVYNHTATEWFDYTVPEYYYRQNNEGTKSNASGCGNETASDRAMYHKYMSIPLPIGQRNITLTVSVSTLWAYMTAIP